MIASHNLCEFPYWMLQGSVGLSPETLTSWQCYKVEGAAFGAGRFTWSPGSPEELCILGQDPQFLLGKVHNLLFSLHFKWKQGYILFSFTSLIIHSFTCSYAGHCPSLGNSGSEQDIPILKELTF